VLYRRTPGRGTGRRAATLARAIDHGFLSQCLRTVNESLLHATPHTHTLTLVFPGGDPGPRQRGAKFLDVDPSWPEKSLLACPLTQAS